MATTAAPDGVILDVPVGGVDGSPSQERLVRIAAMLRDAELRGAGGHEARRPRTTGLAYRGGHSGSAAQPDRRGGAVPSSSCVSG